MIGAGEDSVRTIRPRGWVCPGSGPGGRVGVPVWGARRSRRRGRRCWSGPPPRLPGLAHGVGPGASRVPLRPFRGAAPMSSWGRMTRPANPLRTR